MRLLLGSGGFRTEDRRHTLFDAMRDFFGATTEILFIPYALGDHDAYTQAIVDQGFHAGYQLRGIHATNNPVAAIKDAHAVYVGGGNSFRLVRKLHELNLAEAIRNRVRAGELLYMGVSAGANVACPSIQTTNDMPITYPPSFQAIGLVPFQINPHYFPGQTVFRTEDGELHEHFGETRDLRIREFHEMNDAVVVGLYEGALLRVEERTVTLLGGPARVFAKGSDPVDVHAGDDLSHLLDASH